VVQPPASALRVSVAPAGDDGAVLMAVRGNLDIDSAPVLRDNVIAVLATATCRVVVDLGGLDFCDSVGLSTLVDAHLACQARGGYFRLAEPSAFLTRILTVVGLSRRLAIYDTVDAALADEPAGGRPPPDPAGPTR
jgi:anti-anti-sigma factor